MASVTSRESLKLARNYAEKVFEKRALHGSFQSPDDFLGDLSRIMMDALDCVLTEQPFYSETLDVLAISISCRERQSDMSKFAYAFSRLMSVLSGSIIGLQNDEPMPVLESENEIKTEPVDEVEESERELTITCTVVPVDRSAEGMKLEELEEEIPLGLVKQEDMVDSFDANLQDARRYLEESQPGPSSQSSNRVVVHRPGGAQNQKVDAKRSEWLREELRHQMGGIAKGRDYYKTPDRGPAIKPSRRPKRAKPADAHYNLVYLGNLRHCHLCNTQFVNLATHEELCHTDYWLSNSRKCPAAGCDYRVVSDEAREEHIQTLHGGSLVAKHNFSLPEGTKCPYCPSVVSNVPDFVSHMDNHRSVWNNRAAIYFCWNCNFKCVRIYLMIKHWNQKDCSYGLRFNYDVAMQEVQLAAAEAPAAVAATPQRQPKKRVKLSDQTD